MLPKFERASVRRIGEAWGFLYETKIFLHFIYAEINLLALLDIFIPITNGYQPTGEILIFIAGMSWIFFFFMLAPLFWLGLMVSKLWIIYSCNRNSKEPWDTIFAFFCDER